MFSTEGEKKELSADLNKRSMRPKRPKTVLINKEME